MAIIRRNELLQRSIWEPWNLFDVENWHNFREQSTEECVLVPKTDIYEDEESYQIAVELPGLTREDVHINLNSNILTISGERQYPQNTGCTLSEGSYGKFERSFTIGEQVDREGIEAKMENGVLRVVLQKREEVKPRQIEITSS